MTDNIEIIKNKDIPQKSGIIIFKFVLFGIASLLAWNAILTELNFFNTFIKQLNPFVTISFLNFAPNIILQFILLYKKNLFKIENQLIFALVASIILLMGIPMSVILLESQKVLNLFVTIILFLIMGLVNALISSGFFSFASLFPLEMIIALSTGQGFAGIILNIIKYIILLILPTIKMGERKKEILTGVIFFSISAAILIVCLIIFICSLKTDYFYYYLYNKKSVRISKILEDEGERSYENNDETEGLTEYNLEESQKITFIGMFKLLYDINLLCVFIYIVTFALYPVSINKIRLFSLKEGDYNLNTILTIYNFFDTLGRYLVSKVTPTKKLAYFSSLIRAIFLATFILGNYFQDRYNQIFTSIFIIINVTLFALTNGIGTTLCFGIAPTLVKDELKGQAGASVSFFTIVGIFLGACLAFLTGDILNKVIKLKNPNAK